MNSISIFSPNWNQAPGTCIGIQTSSQNRLWCENIDIKFLLFALK